MNEPEGRYKVSRVASKYGLERIEETLVEYWTMDEDSMSLRDLATFFNKRILRAVLEDADMDFLEGEIDNIYRLLTDDDVSSGVRTETKKKLDRNGVAVDELESDFVTYQAIRTFLKQGAGIEYKSTKSEDRIENVIQSVNRLQNRTEAVTENNLSQLNQTGKISVGDFRVFVDVQVFCEDCETQYAVDELLHSGGCECSLEE